MPEQPDDEGLVPPIKVMRKRLNGVYSAEGFAGPTRRYVLIVAMLVGLASLPTLAAITAGSQELDDGRSGAMDVPFLPPASTGPVRVRPAPTASTGSGSPNPDGTAPGGASPPASSGTLRGQAQKRKNKPRPVAPVKDGKGYAQSTRGGSTGGSSAAGSSGSGSSGSGSRSGSGSGSSGDRGESWLPRPSAGSDSGSSPGKPGPVRPPVLPSIPVKPDDSHNEAPGGSSGGGSSGGSSGGDSSDDSAGGGSSGGSSGGGDRPDRPARPVRPPWCVDRSDCSSRPSHHHRPARPRHQDCDDSGHGDRSARRGQGDSGHGDRSGRRGRDDGSGHRARARRSFEGEKTIQISIRTAQAARSDSRRRSAVTERPQNVRPSRTADRTHNSNRYQPYAADRGEVTQTTTATRAYRGSHRAERMHRAGDPAGAHQRSSRMGRHHLEPQQDPQDHQQNRW